MTTTTPPDLESLRIDRSMKSARASKRRRWPIWVAAIVAIALLAGFYTRRPAVAEVDVFRVPKPLEASEDGTIVLNATGYIVAAHSIALAPRVVGRVSWVGVEMGDRVTQGQELVRLEDDEYRARLLQAQGQFQAAQARLAELEAGSRVEEVARAEAELAQAEVDLQNADVTVRRNRELAASNAISKQVIDDAEARYRAQSARVNALRAGLDLVKAGPRKQQIDAQKAMLMQMQGIVLLAENDMKNTAITAPLAGTILERNVEVGEYVTTGFVGEGGAKGYVVSLADLSNLRVELDISQSDFQRIAMDQTVTITTDAYPDRKYKGVVALISPEANRQKATVLVKVQIENPDEYLKPDMNASVAFHRVGNTTAASQPSGFTVPAAALQGGRVFIVSGGKAVERDVESIPSSGEKVRVTSGLEGGEQIVINPPATLVSGAAVKVREPS